MTAPLVVLGDALLDVDLVGTVTRQCPDAPAAPVLDVQQERRRPGGAGLAALLAAASAVPVRLVTALADDADAAVLRALLEPHMEVVAGRVHGTTAVKCRLRAQHRSLFRIDRGSGAAAPVHPALGEALDGAAAVLVSDYGRGIAADPLLRERLVRLAGQLPVVWDPHPHGAAPVPGCTLASPNLDEARRAAGLRREPGGPGFTGLAGLAGAAASRLRACWAVEGVVVTLGAHGALLHTGGQAQLVPAPPVTVGDPCGAGDRFAVSAALALLAGRSPLAAVRTAVRDAAGFVAAGGAGTLAPPPAQPNAKHAEPRERRPA